MMLWSFGQVRATMLHPGMRTCSIFNTQHVATRHNRVANMLRPTMLRYVALKFCNPLAGACKCWANNVGICCGYMLRWFGRGFIIISRCCCCCCAEDVKEMYRDLYRTCTAIDLLIKPFVWCRCRCRLIYKLSNNYFMRSGRHPIALKQRNPNIF